MVTWPSPFGLWDENACVCAACQAVEQLIAYSSMASRIKTRPEEIRREMQANTHGTVRRHDRINEWFRANAVEFSLTMPRVGSANTVVQNSYKVRGIPSGSFSKRYGTGLAY